MVEVGGLSSSTVVRTISVVMPRVSSAMSCRGLRSMACWLAVGIGGPSRGSGYQTSSIWPLTWTLASPQPQADIPGVVVGSLSNSSWAVMRTTVTGDSDGPRRPAADHRPTRRLSAMVPLPNDNLLALFRAIDDIGIGQPQRTPTGGRGAGRLGWLRTPGTGSRWGRLAGPGLIWDAANAS